MSVEVQNPFTLIFGKSPLESISRLAQTNEIIDAFSTEILNQQIYMITGVRGSGKTVMLTDISKHFKKDKGWIVIELNPDRDLLRSFAAKLYDEKYLQEAFLNAKLDLSIFGIGVSVEKSKKFFDIENAIQAMLDIVKKKKKRVLISIDEAVSNEEMKIFAGTFQILVRNEYPIFLLMTGLFENIDALQNEKNLTFLYRAPKIKLQPLDKGAVKQKYQEIFSLSNEAALEMAELTKGYPFAFQVLGYLTWQKAGDYKSVIGMYRQYLSEYVYDKIWSELSKKDRSVCCGIAETDSGKIKEIRDKLSMKTNEFNPYRDRLKKKGIINCEEHGYVYFSLPEFSDYVLTHAL